MNMGSRLPNFIAVGPPRTATTWLHEILKAYIGLPSGVKETQYFLNNYSLGISWYQSFFQRCSPDLPIGEIAPTYFDQPEARQRIKETIPDCKIVCTLRDPVARIYSQYKVWTSMGLIDGAFDYRLLHQYLGACGSYAFNIKAWIAMFGRDRVLVLCQEDLEADPQGFVNLICAFIGCPTIDMRASRLRSRRVLRILRRPRNPKLALQARKFKDWAVRHKLGRVAHIFETDNLVFNLCFGGGQLFGPLEPAVESQLRSLLCPEIEELEVLLGRDLTHWKVSRHL
jgi:hypothetical protein